MMKAGGGGEPDTEELLNRAGRGDLPARRTCWRGIERLRQMVALRIDRRMASRVDLSDVVQDALADAGPESE